MWEFASDDIDRLITLAGGILYRVHWQQQNLLHVEVDRRTLTLAGVKLAPNYGTFEQFTMLLPEGERPLYDQSIRRALIEEKEIRFKHKLDHGNRRAINVQHVVKNFRASSRSGQLLGLIQKIDLTQHFNNNFYNIFNEELQAKQKEVEDLEAALKLILKNVETEKQTVRNNIAMYFEREVIPVFKELKKNNKTNQKINTLIGHFKNLFDGHNRKLFLLQNGLTSKELEICSQLVQGQSGKEVASNMDISYLTFRTHTRNIRRKLSLKRHQNLSLFLEEHLAVR